MSCKTFDSVCAEFSGLTQMAYFEEFEFKDPRALFLDPETGEVIGMMRKYRKKIYYHPQVDLAPDVAVTHGIVIATIKTEIRIGEYFYYDKLMEDVFYGDAAIDASYGEIDNGNGINEL